MFTGNNLLFLVAGSIVFLTVIAILFFRACSLLNERYDAGDDWDDLL